MLSWLPLTRWRCSHQRLLPRFGTKSHANVFTCKCYYMQMLLHANVIICKCYYMQMLNGIILHLCSLELSFCLCNSIESCVSSLNLLSFLSDSHHIRSGGSRLDSNMQTLRSSWARRDELRNELCEYQFTVTSGLFIGCNQQSALCSSKS